MKSSRSRVLSTCWQNASTLGVWRKSSPKISSRFLHGSRASNGFSERLLLDFAWWINVRRREHRPPPHFADTRLSQQCLLALQPFGFAFSLFGFPKPLAVAGIWSGDQACGLQEP